MTHAPLWKQLKLLSSRTVLDQHSWLFWRFADLHTCPRSYPPLARAVTAPTAYKYHFCRSVLYTAFSSTSLACNDLWEKSETFLLLCYMPSTASPLRRIEAGEMARKREKEAQKNRQKHPSSYFLKKFQLSSVQLLSRVRLCDPMNRSTPDLPVHHQLRVYSNCSSSQWCHPAISSSVIPFSSCPQSLQASGSFPMSQLFASGGQSIEVSALTSVLPMNTQDWSPLGWTGWISLQSKGL